MDINAIYANELIEKLELEPPIDLYELCKICNIEIVKELIKRPTYPAPKVSLNPEIKDFYKFTTDDIIIEDYQAGPQIKNIPIAV